MRLGLRHFQLYCSEISKSKLLQPQACDNPNNSKHERQFDNTNSQRDYNSIFEYIVLCTKLHIE